MQQPSSEWQQKMKSSDRLRTVILSMLIPIYVYWCHATQYPEICDRNIFAIFQWNYYTDCLFPHIIRHPWIITCSVIAIILNSTFTYKTLLSIALVVADLIFEEFMNEEPITKNLLMGLYKFLTHSPMPVTIIIALIYFALRLRRGVNEMEASLQKAKKST